MILASLEPNATAALLAVLGLLLAACAVFTRGLDRVGIPVVLIFMVMGIVGGSEGLGRIEFNNFDMAYRLGTVALVMILFDGGMNTTWRSIRISAGPAGVLATVGVVGTAGALAAAGRALGLSWREAILVGAIVSSTDAAAVFAVLRGGSLKLKERVGSIIEVESCLNDPMAVILTLGAVQVFLSDEPVSLWLLAVSIPIQLVVGAAVGVGFGYVTRFILIRARLGTGGLFPVVTIGCALLAYGAATLLMGSGILAVFVSGLMVGNGALPYKPGLRRIHDALAWMSQVGMFLMLGLLVTPSDLVPVAKIGILLGLILAAVARPLVVALCMLPFGGPKKEMGFTAWVGLRGAVPIILATFPTMAGLPEGGRVFHIVFFIVVFSALVPGASILPLARRLRLEQTGGPDPAAALELNSLKQLDGDILVYRIRPSVIACDATLAEISFPPGASVILVMRGDQLLAARGPTKLLDGDHVYVFCKPQDEPLMGLIFGEPLDSA